MIVHEDCKGCRLTRNQIQVNCAYQDSHIAEQCPCLSCLVKAMCNKQQCDIRNNTYGEILYGE